MPPILGSCLGPAKRTMVTVSRSAAAIALEHSVGLRPGADGDDRVGTSPSGAATTTMVAPPDVVRGDTAARRCFSPTADTSPGWRVGPAPDGLPATAAN